MGEYVKSNVVIMGASPVGYWTAKFASLLEFPMLVLDNEAEKLVPFEGIPGVACRVVDFTALPSFEELGITDNSMVCVVTRGHQFDPQSFVYAIKSPAFYVGMLGRPAKNAKCVAYALDHGCTQEEIDRTCFPIGVKIGAIDAAEIGLSVMAQMVQAANAHAPREKDHESLHRA